MLAGLAKARSSAAGAGWHSGGLHSDGVAGQRRAVLAARAQARSRRSATAAWASARRSSSCRWATRSCTPSLASARRT